MCLDWNGIIIWCIFLLTLLLFSKEVRENEKISSPSSSLFVFIFDILCICFDFSAFPVCPMVAWRHCDRRFTVSRSCATATHHTIHERQPASERCSAKRHRWIFVWSNDNDTFAGDPVACDRSSMYVHAFLIYLLTLFRMCDWLMTF